MMWDIVQFPLESQSAYISDEIHSPSFTINHIIIPEFQTPCIVKKSLTLWVRSSDDVLEEGVLGGDQAPPSSRHLTTPCHAEKSFLVIIFNTRPTLPRRLSLIIIIVGSIVVETLFNLNRCAFVCLTYLITGGYGSGGGGAQGGKTAPCPTLTDKFEEKKKNQKGFTWTTCQLKRSIRCKSRWWSRLCVQM